MWLLILAFLLYAIYKFMQANKQKEMADFLNCSQQVYSNYELGQRDIPTEILIKLAVFHNVSTDYILGLTDIPESK